MDPHLLRTAVAGAAALGPTATRFATGPAGAAPGDLMLQLGGTYALGAVGGDGASTLADPESYTPVRLPIRRDLPLTVCVCESARNHTQNKHD